MKYWRLILPVLALFAATLACATFQATGTNFLTPVATVQSQPTVATATAQSVTVPNVVQEQDALVALYNKVQNGIVSIQVTTAQGGDLGSGFVFDDQGHIVTNYHVVDGQTQIEVDYPSGYKTFGKLIGTDIDSDLAVIQTDAPASAYQVLALGDSNNVQVGQIVVAIGNPFGLDNTMTTGIISALGRTLPSERQAPGGGSFQVADMIQTDAAINPGNSGGPLFDLDGNVIGINRAVRTDASTANGEPVNSGIGFAIPIDIVKRVAPQLIANGKYDYPYMGIASPGDLSLQDMQALGLTQYTGAYVSSVTPGGPADKAGIHAGTRDVGLQSQVPAGGDLIIAIDGHPVKTFDDLVSYLVNNKGPGDTVTLTIIRDGKKMDVSVTLDKRP